MKKRIIELMNELWNAHIEFKKSRPETEQGYLILNYNTLFSESCSCYRGEQVGKEKEIKNSKPTKKQLDLLFKLDADFNAEKITFEEAKVLIKEILKKRNEKKN